MTARRLIGACTFSDPATGVQTTVEPRDDTYVVIVRGFPTGDVIDINEGLPPEWEAAITNPDAWDPAFEPVNELEPDQEPVDEPAPNDKPRGGKRRN